MYARRPRDGFGLQARPKPLKRPAQARPRFTVQAIYDAFVRIWQRDGSAGVATRAVALETGVAVGTLYEYFPNKQALLSGYVRYGPARGAGRSPDRRCCGKGRIESDKDVRVFACISARWLLGFIRLPRHPKASKEIR